MAWAQCRECKSELNEPTLKERCMGKQSCPTCHKETSDFLSSDDQDEAIGELVSMVASNTKRLDMIIKANQVTKTKLESSGAKRIKVKIHEE